MNRYFLDIRVGCAAVRDSQHSTYDKSYPGLHHDTPDVIRYKHGYRLNGEWVVKDEDIQELKDLCDKLNVWPHRDKKIDDIIAEK